MKRAVVPFAVAVAVLVESGSVVACCDMFSAGDGWAPPVPAPAPRPAAAPPPSVASVAASLGLHRVTQVWTGDVVRTTGAVTTYTSTTSQQNAGTFAKKVATVATGQSSQYDSQLANPRTTMTDGRLVKGDVYANYISAGPSLVFDRYVFFQDDRSVRQVATHQPTPAPTPRPTPVAIVTPRPFIPVSVAPPPTARPTPAPTPQPTPRPPRIVRVGVSAAPQGDALARIEVLRGRRIPLWFRATVDGTPARVISWRLTSGEVVALGPVSGASDGPFLGSWHSVAVGGVPFVVRFTVTVEVPGEPARTMGASLEVVVRSPGLIE